MTCQEQFNRIAAEYDSGRRKFIPCFDAFYQETTDFIASIFTHAPNQIVDLGAGTGILTAQWFNRFPRAKYVLIDIADEMLDVARKRFLPCAPLSNLGGATNADVIDAMAHPDVRFLAADYSKDFNAVADEVQKADAVISALSIHHLEDSAKQELFLHIYDALPRGGIFANYDQFCADNDECSLWYMAYWEGQIEHSSLTEQELLRWQERRTLDRECSVESEVSMMKKAGFANAQCVFQAQKFAAVIGKK